MARVLGLPRPGTVHFGHSLPTCSLGGGSATSFSAMYPTGYSKWVIESKAMPEVFQKYADTLEIHFGKDAAVKVGLLLVR